MIKHVVMWKLKDEHEGRNRQQLAKELREMLESLKEIIDEIRHIEVGINLSGSDAACDVVLYSEFDSMEDLDVYQKHPEHVKVAQYLSDIRTERHVVDYEI